MNIRQANTQNTIKNQLREQLFGIINQLTVDQTKALLVQASSLAVSEDYGELRFETIQELSARELEVLVLVASGYNRKNIGRTLGISANTAARHIANIYSKLGISTVAEATSIAYRNMLIGGESRVPLWT